MLKNLLKESFLNFKKNILYFIFLSLILILCGAVTFSLDLIGFGIGTIIVFPFLFMPVVFAIQVAIFGFRQDANPNWRLFFRFFSSYFKSTFRGCYRFILSAAFGIILFSIFSTIFSFISESICLSIFPNFSQQLEEVMNSIYNGNVEDVMSLINNDEIRTCFYIAYLPSIGIGAIGAFVSMSFNSFYIYFRIQNSRFAPQYSKVVYRVAKNKIRKNLIKEYWSLNWPLYLLFVAGFVGGTCCSFYLDYNFYYAISFAIIFAIVAMIFYLPMYFSNMETIYLSHQETFLSAPNIAREIMMNNLQNQINIMNHNLHDLEKQKDEFNSKEKNENGNDVDNKDS